MRAAIVLVLGVAACSGREDITRVESLLHTPLRDRPDVHAAYGELNDGDSRGIVFGLTRFDTDDAGFVALCRDLKAEAAQGHGYLPATWSWPLEGARPSWWSPERTTPEMACARPYGSHGWIAAKLEEPHVFVIVTDVGGSDGR